jgi:D-tyrosyl-tRNA(Tyr) deacylase
MRVLLQRAGSARIDIDETEVSSIGKGLLLFVGIHKDDTKECADYLVSKIVNLRIFEDEQGKMNLSALDLGAEILSVSQFTLYGNTSSGRRPSFTDSAKPPISEPLYDYFNGKLRETGLIIREGIFGADMKVSLLNDGPVTLMLEKEN